MPLRDISPGRIYRRINYSGFAALNFLDAILNIFGVSGKVIHPLCSAEVPQAKVVLSDCEDGAKEHGLTSHKVAIRIPYIAHGCMAIADVNRFLINQHPLHYICVAGNHQIVSSQIERFNSQRVERQQ